jgi:hypothetical protein
MLAQNDDNSKSVVKILGTHNGIQLIQKADKTEWCQSTKTNKCAMGIKGIARILECDSIKLRMSSGAYPYCSSVYPIYRYFSCSFTKKD